MADLLAGKDILLMNFHSIKRLRDLVGMLSERLLSPFGVALISYLYPHQEAICETTVRIRKEKNALTKSPELYQLYSLVNATQKVPGDLVEVGVFRGTAEKIICEAKKKRRLHLFDTFEGLPETSAFDPQFHEGQYEATLGEVQAYLAKYPNVYFYKGLFPQQTGGCMSRKHYSFIHLDVDIYKSTKDTLTFLSPNDQRRYYYIPRLCKRWGVQGV